MISAQGRELANKLNPLIGSTNEIDSICTKICRYATKHHRLAEQDCNGPYPIEWSQEWQDELDNSTEQVEKKITELVEQLPETDEGPLTVEFHGDPRGATVKLKINNMERHPSYDGWALEAIIVPTRQG
jgi:hypothetical protein